MTLRTLTALKSAIRRPFGTPAVMAARVAFIGDSITQFWSDEDPGLFRAGWVNRGISGDTTGQMRARFDRDVVSLEPSAVHIMGGTNDLWRGIAGEGADLALANLIAMAQQASSCGMRVILAAPPPIALSPAVAFGQPELLAVMRAALQVACRRDGLTYVDYAESLGNGEAALAPAFTTDGIHLTRRGYRAMRAQAVHAVAAALGL